jgi:transposase-like protein
MNHTGGCGTGFPRQASRKALSAGTPRSSQTAWETDFVGAVCDLRNMTTKYCPGCRADRVVEQPPCLDGHEDCPEWVCTECGTAIVFGWLTADIVSPPSRRGGKSSAA